MNYMGFLEKAVEKHSSVFDYSKANYINYKTKITIICKEHGEFQQTPSMHLKSKYCCPQCLVIGRTKKLTMTQTDFILKANAKHNNIYNYTLTNYIKWNIKVDIICNIHGVFSQEANSHLRGHGCPRCSDARTSYSSNYTKYKDKPTTLYYIKISDLYWKIGLTKQTVERRFKKEINSGVKIETIFTKVYEDGWEAYLIEQDAIIETIGYKIQKCDSPILGGWTEIRSVDFINKIKI